jgi:hypothetical protein
MVRIIQLLCPLRHCIVAGAYEGAEAPNESVMVGFRADVQKLLDSNAINPWCGICHSRVWHYEDGRTKFATMEEAQPFIDQTQRENEATRRMFANSQN